MTGEIRITMKEVKEPEKNGTEMSVSVQVRNCGMLEKLKVVESVCQGLETSLEEMLMIQKLDKIIEQVTGGKRDEG